MSDAIYCFDTATVRFAVYPQGPGGTRVIAEIGEDPLRDLFGAEGAGDTLVDAYYENASVINALALKRHREAPEVTVLLETIDFEAIGRVGLAPSVVRTLAMANLVAQSELVEPSGPEARQAVGSTAS
ncbi:hypothetical protein QTI66_10060 [Variovorax sp. J22R133]|uniref:hypothetical protein n=1 Tax=Variovorax brevis TaxID=3053503 RepID=UPI002575C0C8|nr:hypothetical protein [Variovorax sp. J22R133]MDM0112495.1 hypothetical protein [Variovorax sp. J22R133]